MFPQILHKLLYAVATLFGVMTVIFILFNILPGDPSRMLLGQRENSEQLANIRKKHGFDQPILTQYGYYLNDVSPISIHSTNPNNYTFLTSEKYTYYPIVTLGESTWVLKYPYLRTSFQKNGKKVADVLKETLPNTAVLAIAAISLAVFFGILFGIFAALYKNTFFDKAIAVFSTLGMSVPSFFSAILAAWFFGFILHKYTHLEMTGSLYMVDDFGEYSRIQWKNLILPALVLGSRPLAVIIQLTRNSLLEILNQEYVRTAKAKGLNKYQIITRHALRNALNPVITAISGWFASMLAGAVFVEYVFNWNGLGKEIVTALNTLDLPVIMGSVLVIATVFIVINSFVDLLYSWLDPRIKT